MISEQEDAFSFADWVKHDLLASLAVAGLANPAAVAAICRLAIAPIAPREVDFDRLRDECRRSPGDHAQALFEASRLAGRLKHVPEQNALRVEAIMGPSGFLVGPGVRRWTVETHAIER